MIKVILITLVLGQQYTPTEQAFLKSQLGSGAPATLGHPVIPPDYEPKAPKNYEPSQEQRDIYKRREESKAQSLRDKWMAQWIVQNQNISPSDIKRQRDMLEALSTKDLLNVEKEMNRRASRYMSQKAKYAARVAAANRPRPYYYWRYSPYYGYRRYMGYRNYYKSW